MTTPIRDRDEESATVDASVAGIDGRRAVYTVTEVAAMLDLSRGSAYAMVRAGQIPALRLGSRWVIPKRRFHEWLNDRPISFGRTAAEADPTDHHCIDHERRHLS